MGSGVVGEREGTHQLPVKHSGITWSEGTRRLFRPNSGIIPPADLCRPYVGAVSVRLFLEYFDKRTKSAINIETYPEHSRSIAESGSSLVSLACQQEVEPENIDLSALENQISDLDKLVNEILRPTIVRTRYPKNKRIGEFAGEIRQFVYGYPKYVFRTFMDDVLLERKFKKQQERKVSNGILPRSGIRARGTLGISSSHGGDFSSM